MIFTQKFDLTFCDAPSYKAVLGRETEICAANRSPERREIMNLQTKQFFDLENSGPKKVTTAAIILAAVGVYELLAAEFGVE